MTLTTDWSACMVHAMWSIPIQNLTRRFARPVSIIRFQSTGSMMDGGKIPPMPRIIHPDWYRIPMAEDDPRMIGDYPAAPTISHQLRDPYGQYFDQQNRRNWGEILPEDYEPLLMWSFDVEERYGWPWLVASFGGLFGGCFLLYQTFGKTPSKLANQRVNRKFNLLK